MFKLKQYEITTRNALSVLMPNIVERRNEVLFVLENVESFKSSRYSILPVQVKNLVHMQIKRLSHRDRITLTFIIYIQ